MFKVIIFIIILILIFSIYFQYLNKKFHQMNLKVFFKKIYRKIFKTIFKKNPFDYPVGEKSVYHTINAKNNLSQTGKTILLNIPTSDNFAQAVHPDVIFIKDGFGVKKNKFWMVCTPYPNQDDRYENPEVFSSEDGFFWNLPSKDVNPIAKKPDEFLSHNSDASLIHDGDKIIVFFRTSFYKNNKNNNLIQSIESKDGINWTNLKTLMQSNNHLYLSPIVKKVKNEWVMWTIDYSSKNRNYLSIYRWTSKDLINWNNCSEVRCEGLPEKALPWHIGLETVDNGILCIITSCEKIGGKKSIWSWIK